MRRVVFAASTFVLCAFWSSGAFAEEGPVAWWKFDEGRGNIAADRAGRIDDLIAGNYEYAEGVVGKSLRFDGYTTFIRRKVSKAPQLSEAFTIEAWIAPQTYSWNWTGIVDQGGQEVSEEKEGGELTLTPGLFGAKFNESDFTNPDSTDLLEVVDHNWTGGYKDWSARWRGHIEAPYTGEVVFSAEADNGLKLEIDNKVVISGMGRDKARSGTISLVKGKRYPIVLSYYQDGDPSFLRLYWSWQGKDRELVAASALAHSEKDKQYVKTEEMAFKKAV